ncbi:hypothetical protein U2054_15640, partial [Listeria monocytogenes]|uniref:hypothetical protein n=1 Tax=Listeria monocytogenes TaxID=1639 RepID=UPI002FDC0A6E
NGYDPRNGCKFYSNQSEKLIAFHTDATFDYNLFKQKNKFRFGFAGQHKNKYFGARIFNYLIASNANFKQSLSYLSQNEMFAEEN